MFIRRSITRLSRPYRLDTTINKGQMGKNTILLPGLDLRSDTVTLPSMEMREIMSDALCGDDVYGEDFTIAELESYMAEITGKEAALFVLTGTMSNFLATISTCSPGEEVIAGHLCHLARYEQGNIARFGSIPFRAIETQKDGTLAIDDIVQYGYFSKDDFHMSHTTMVCIENTHNFLGGIPLDLSYLKCLWEASKQHGFRIHTDGARLINASISTGHSLRELCQYSDSVSMCFTKGLGCPFGGILVGDKVMIDKARRARKSIGGQWRQGGMAAAACLHSIQNTDPIVRDHLMAKKWAEDIAAKCSNITVNTPQSNIVLLHCPSASFAANIIDKMESGPIAGELYSALHLKGTSFNSVF